MSVTCRVASFTARKEKPHFTQVRLSTLFNPHHNKSRPHVSVYIFAFSLQTVERWHEGVIGLQIPLLVAFKAEAVKPEDKCSPQINIWLCSECFPLVYTSPNLDLRLKIVRYETFVQKHDMQPFLQIIHSCSTGYRCCEARKVWKAENITFLKAHGDHFGEQHHKWDVLVDTPWRGAAIKCICYL